MAYKQNFDITKMMRRVVLHLNDVISKLDPY